MVLYPYRIHFREEMLLCGFVEEVIFFFLILSLFLVWKLDRCRQATINFLFLFLYFFIFFILNFHLLLSPDSEFPFASFFCEEGSFFWVSKFFKRARSVLSIDWLCTSFVQLIPCVTIACITRYSVSQVRFAGCIRRTEYAMAFLTSCLKQKLISHFATVILPTVY